MPFTDPPPQATNDKPQTIQASYPSSQTLGELLPAVTNCYKSSENSHEARNKLLQSPPRAGSDLLRHNKWPAVLPRQQRVRLLGPVPRKAFPLRIQRQRPPQLVLRLLQSNAHGFEVF